MNIDHFEAFMYVVHLESIHKAAEALYLSQPTVTARIKSLERDLGIELFLRKGRSLTLSEEGKPLSHMPSKLFVPINKERNY